MSCERVRSFSEAKLSSICCCSPDPQGSLHCHRRKLGWLDVICSWEIEAGCYLSPGYILGAKRQIAWLFIPRIFWALKSSRFIPNSPDSPSFFFSIFFFFSGRWCICKVIIALHFYQIAWCKWQRVALQPWNVNGCVDLPWDAGEEGQVVIQRYCDYGSYIVRITQVSLPQAEELCLV